MVPKNDSFELHAQLRRDCVPLGSFALSRLLLMNERRYPWFLLVPQRATVSEIHQLSEEDQGQLWKESSCLARTLVQVYAPDKLNIASLGNLVPQLHVHHIVRYRGDAAWPAPVWGRFEPAPYPPEQVQQIGARVREILDSIAMPGWIWTAE